MPKHQSTAAKRARAAARDGAKYTEALRAEQAQAGPDAASDPRVMDTIRRLDEATTAARDDADPYRRVTALTARALSWQSLAEVMSQAAAGELDLDAATLAELLERAARAAMFAAELDQHEAARTRIMHAVPTITPRTEVARLGLIRCARCGEYWTPDADRPDCLDHPGVVHGPTPRDVAEAEALFGTRRLLSSADLAEDPAGDDY